MEQVKFDFLVREDLRVLLEKRIDALGQGYRQNLAFVGPPGLGKTRMLTGIYAALSSHPAFLPIYIAADTTGAEALAERWIGAALSGLFMSQGIQPPNTLQSLLLASDPIVPRTTEKIRQLKRAIRRDMNSAVVKDLFALSGVLAQETGKTVVLMVDEFHLLGNLPAPDPFLLLGKEIMVQKNTLYIAASSQTEKARRILRDQFSMLFGNFEVVELEPYGFTETAQFLADRFPGYRFSATARDFLIRFTDGRPGYLAWMADALEMRLAVRGQSVAIGAGDSSEIPADCVLEAFLRELLPETGRLAQYFLRRMDTCKRQAKDAAPYVQALLAISHGRRKAAGIAAFINRKVKETQKILQRLQGEGLIVRSGVFYVLGDPLFQFWLREVFERFEQSCMPGDSVVAEDVFRTLRREYDRMESRDYDDIHTRVEALFKEFHNDLLEVDQKKLQCPQFSEIIFRPSGGRISPLFARSSKIRWVCQIAREPVREEDVAAFLDDLKRSRKKPQRRILITLEGIDQNAKLMAQQAGFQLWNLRTFNTLLELYDLPKVILLSEKKKNTGSGQAPLLAASAQSA